MPIQNLSRLKRKLKKLPAAAEAAMRPVMEKIADEVVALARSLVSVVDRDLYDSIGWTWGDVPKGSIVLGTTRAGKTGNMVITIYAGDDKAFYARWVEFGTAPHFLGKGGKGGPRHPGSKPYPFFYPSWRARRKTTRTRMSRALNKEARRVAANG